MVAYHNCKLGYLLFSHSQTAFFLLYWGRKKGSGEQPTLFLFGDPQNLGMLLIGAGLKNNGSLIGENDAILIREGHMSLLHGNDW